MAEEEGKRKLAGAFAKAISLTSKEDNKRHFSLPQATLVHSTSTNLGAMEEETGDSVPDEEVNATFQMASQSINPFLLYCIAKPFAALPNEMRYNPSSPSSLAFIHTASGNLVSRRAFVFGSNNVHLTGRSVIGPTVILRGDMAKLRIGKYVIINPDAVLRPPPMNMVLPKNFSADLSERQSVKREEVTASESSVCENSSTAPDTTETAETSSTPSTSIRREFLPLSINDFVYIGARSLVECASIEENVWIGENCIIGKRSILMQCCHILPNSVLPPDTVVPSFTIFGGSPAKFVGSLPESTDVVFKDLLMDCYKLCAPPDEDDW